VPCAWQGHLRTAALGLAIPAATAQAAHNGDLDPTFSAGGFCTSPKTYRGLKRRGRYTLRVRAIDPA
jgi:hypothetical protein